MGSTRSQRDLEYRRRDEFLPGQFGDPMFQ